MDESERPTELRKRSEEPTFISLDNQPGVDEDLKKLFRIRQVYINIEQDAKEATEELEKSNPSRKDIDKKLLSIVERDMKDGISYDGILLDRVYNKGQESTNWNYLRKVLTPEQMVTAKKSGTPYVYLKTTQLKD